MRDGQHRQSAGSSRGLVVVLTGTVAVAWGFVYFFLDVLLDYLEPIQVLALRWLLAGVVMLLLAALHVFKVQVTRQNLPYLIAIGLVQAVIYPLTEVFGLDLTSASILSICEALIPCASVILGALFFHKRTNLMGVLSIIVVFAGVIICTVFASDFAAAGKFLGYVIILCGIFATGLYSQMAAKVGDTVNALSITLVMSVTGGIVHTAENFVLGYGWSTYTTMMQDWRLVGCIAFLGIISAILCFSAYNKAMAIAKNPGLAANVNAGLVTVVGVCAGVFLRGDVSGWYTVIGVLVILVGVALSTKQV